MVVGEETPDEGAVSVPKKLTIGYFRGLAQPCITTAEATPRFAIFEAWVPGAMAAAALAYAPKILSIGKNYTIEPNSLKTMEI
jgi:hypothetical protein